MTPLKEDRSALTAYAEDLGYTAMGPVLLRFSVWLAGEAKRLGFRRLYFLSREGFFMMELFKKLRSIGLIEGGFDIRYLYISRRAAFGAVEKSLELLEAMILAGPFDGKLYDLMDARIGVDADFCRSNGLPNLSVNVPDDPDAIVEAVTPLLPALNRRAEQERGPLLDYLRKEGFLDREPVAVVDVGYSASIQRWLGEVTHRKLAGFYFASTSAIEEWESGQNRVYACFATGCSPAKTPPVYRYALAFEAWLTAPHGQVLRFTEEGKPQFAPGGRMQKDFELAQAVAKGVERYFEDMAFLAQFNPNWDRELAAVVNDVLVAAMESGVFGRVFDALSIEDQFCGSGEISLSERIAELMSDVKLSEVLAEDDES